MGKGCFYKLCPDHRQYQLTVKWHFIRDLQSNQLIVPDPFPLLCHRTSQHRQHGNCTPKNPFHLQETEGETTWKTQQCCCAVWPHNSPNCSGTVRVSLLKTNRAAEPSSQCKTPRKERERASETRREEKNQNKGKSHQNCRCSTSHNQNKWGHAAPMMENKAKQMHQTLLLRQEMRNWFKITNTQSHPGVWKPQCCVQQSHEECPNMKYSKGQNLVWHGHQLDFWARWLMAAGELHTAGHPFPRDPALGEHHTSRVTWDCLCQSLFPAAQAPQRKPAHAWQQLPFQHQHQNGTEFIIPSPCFQSGSPRSRRDPQWLFHVAQPETQHEDFNSRRQQCDLQKRTPRTQHHRQYGSVDYTHSAQPALLLETSCQFSTGTGILVSMKLSWCWRAPRGLLSMRRMGLFWIVSTRSRWGKKKHNRRTKNNRHAATKC